jgi:hypothetical protein
MYGQARAGVRRRRWMMMVEVVLKEKRVAHLGSHASNGRDEARPLVVCAPPPRFSPDRPLVLPYRHPRHLRPSRRVVVRVVHHPSRHGAANQHSASDAQHSHRPSGPVPSQCCLRAPRVASAPSNRLWSSLPDDGRGRIVQVPLGLCDIELGRTQYSQSADYGTGSLLRWPLP